MNEEMTFGDWIREKRKELRLSQQDIVDRSNGKLKQSTLSSYEKNKVNDISIGKALNIAVALGIAPRELPWDLLEKKMCANESSRLSMYELPQTANSVKLFNGKTYEIQGFLGRDTGTGEIKKISEIYYHVRTAQMDGMVCAKRKKPHQELRIITI